MSKQKKEVSIAGFKVTSSWKNALIQEMETDNRDQGPMIQLLVAEAISYRQAKRTINKLL